MADADDFKQILDDPTVKAKLDSLAEQIAWLERYGENPWLDLPPDDFESTNIAKLLHRAGVDRAKWESATRSERRAVKTAARSLTTAFDAVRTVLSDREDEIAKDRAEGYLRKISRLHDAAARSKTGFVRDRERRLGFEHALRLVGRVHQALKDPDFMRLLRAAKEDVPGTRATVLVRIKAALPRMEGPIEVKDSDLDALSTRSPKKAARQVIGIFFPWLRSEDLRLGRIRHRLDRRRR